MANKKKLLTATAAVATSAALLLTGTFAWQSINQTALNEASDVINPGGRLHDDFNGENKDIYVENFADEPIYARIRLEEYFEIIANYGVDGIETSNVLLGNKSETTDDEGNIVVDYEYTLFNNYDSLADGTFNMNKDSLKADINGIYEEGNVGTISERVLDLDADDAQYSEYKEYTEGETLTGDEIYDADANNLDDDGTTTISGVEHTAKSTLGATLISMDEWTNDYNSEPGEYWVYDTDGWVYWAQAIPGRNEDGSTNATGLLLDSIELNQVMDDTWYYAINVVAQFVTADDVGKTDNTGFYAEGQAPTAEAEALLEAIGVDMSGEAAGDEGGTSSDTDVTKDLELTLTSGGSDTAVAAVDDEITLTIEWNDGFDPTGMYTQNSVTIADDRTLEEGTEYDISLTGNSGTLTITDETLSDGQELIVSVTYSDDENNIEYTYTGTVTVVASSSDSGDTTNITTDDDTLNSLSDTVTLQLNNYTDTVTWSASSEDVVVTGGENGAATVTFKTFEAPTAPSAYEYTIIAADAEDNSLATCTVKYAPATYTAKQVQHANPDVVYEINDNVTLSMNRHSGEFYIEETSQVTWTVSSEGSTTSYTGSGNINYDSFEAGTYTAKAVCTCPDGATQEVTFTVTVEENSGPSM